MGFVRRRARRRTALLVGGAAYAAGRSGRETGPRSPRPRRSLNRSSSRKSRRRRRLPPRAAKALTSTRLSSISGDLHASGVLTDEEFAAAKAKILGTASSQSGAEERS